LFKEFSDVFFWSYEDIPKINPHIVEHEITTYPDVKPIWQKLHSINPLKEVAIKDEVEILIKFGFIYPMQLTEWISNLVHVNKKQGVIRICMYFRDLNKAYLKENFLTSFIDHIIDECAGCEVFYFYGRFFWV
jgi:hypothetical protein